MPEGTDLILVVEDDIVDIMTVQRAMKELRVARPIQIVRDGEEALRYLRAPGRPKPQLIILDINMPRMNGLELLREIKQDAELQEIPAVILTTSSEEQDRRAGLDLGVSEFIVKPVDYREFVEALRSLEPYWRRSDVADTPLEE